MTNKLRNHPPSRARPTRHALSSTSLWSEAVLRITGHMTIDDELTAQTRVALKGASAVSEVKMFGGIGFMLNGNMVAAASHRGLLVRVGKEAEDDALSRPGARLMTMKGRAFPGYVQVERSTLDARSVKSWVRLARAFVETLPPKKKKAAKAKKHRA
jgi:TfoX/Sxy family transcriptional regulator of competence genes